MHRAAFSVSEDIDTTVYRYHCSKTHINPLHAPWAIPARTHALLWYKRSRDPSFRDIEARRAASKIQNYPYDWARSMVQRARSPDAVMPTQSFRKSHAVSRDPTLMFFDAKLFKYAFAEDHGDDADGSAAFGDAEQAERSDMSSAQLGEAHFEGDDDERDDYSGAGSSASAAAAAAAAAVAPAAASATGSSRVQPPAYSWGEDDLTGAVGRLDIVSDQESDSPSGFAPSIFASSASSGRKRDREFVRNADEQELSQEDSTEAIMMRMADRAQTLRAEKMGRTY